MNNMSMKNFIIKSIRYGEDLLMKSAELVRLQHENEEKGTIYYYYRQILSTY
jgi:hypothetical protein